MLRQRDKSKILTVARKLESPFTSRDLYMALQGSLTRTGEPIPLEYTFQGHKLAPSYRQISTWLGESRLFRRVGRDGERQLVLYEVDA